MNNDEPEERVSRTITIEVYEGGGFNVKEGESYTRFLSWDEMLGVVAELTHRHIGRSGIRMSTREEWEEEARRRQARRESNTATLKEQQS